MAQSSKGDKNAQAYAPDAVSEIANLDQFYHSPAGRLVSYLLRRQLQSKLSLEADIDRLGFGYPFMLMPKSNLPVLVPSEMGALAYGAPMNILTSSVHSHAWPIASESMNQIIMCHGLEYCFDGAACLSEANRVLASAGELFLIVPNRRSLWVRDDKTPLGHGRPFSKGQITKLLTKTGFEINEVRRALFLPPAFTNLPLRLAQTIDRLGSYSWALFGGVIIIRATKLRYATKGKSARAMMPVLSPAIKPAAKPALGRTSQ